MMCHESSSQSWVIDCRNPLIARLSTSFVKTWVFVCRCHLAAFHLRSSAVSCCGRPIFLWALLCPSFCQLWQRLCDSGRLCSTHGWMFGLFFLFLFPWARVTSASWLWAGTGGRYPSEWSSSWGWSIPRRSAQRGSSRRGTTSGSPEPGQSEEWITWIYKKKDPAITCHRIKDSEAFTAVEKRLCSQGCKGLLINTRGFSDSLSLLFSAL